MRLVPEVLSRQSRHTWCSDARRASLQALRLLRGLPALPVTVRSKELVLALVLGATVVPLLACADDDAGGSRAAVRGDSPLEPDEEEAFGADGSLIAGGSLGATRWYVFHGLAIDPDDGAPGAGFDLDAARSVPNDPKGCGFADTRSAIDPDQNGICEPGGFCPGSVDNMLPTLAQAIDTFTGDSTRDAVDGALATGRVVWLLRISGINNSINDGAVTIAVYRGFSTDTDCSKLFGGKGRFVVSEDSVSLPGDVDAPRYVTSGRIVAGRLRARFGSSIGIADEGRIDVGGFGGADPIPSLPVFQLQIRASFDRAMRAGTRGNLGAWARVGDLRETLAGAGPNLRTAFAALLPRIADIFRDGSCGGGFAADAGGMSFGLRFSLARAYVSNGTASPPAGACGSED